MSVKKILDKINNIFNINKYCSCEMSPVFSIWESIIDLWEKIIELIFWESAWSLWEKGKNKFNQNFSFF